MTQNSEGPCPLCGREMIAGRSLNKHHIVPKTFKGRETFLIHTVCHSKIHSVLTERELLQTYNTFEALRAHPEIQRFVQWLQGKPPEFRSKNKKTRRMKNRRRRR